MLSGYLFRDQWGATEAGPVRNSDEGAAACSVGAGAASCASAGPGSAVRAAMPHETTNALALTAYLPDGRAAVHKSRVSSDFLPGHGIEDTLMAPKSLARSYPEKGRLVKSFFAVSKVTLELSVRPAGAMRAGVWAG